jgi:plastocyanin/cytochrome c5
VFHQGGDGTLQAYNDLTGETLWRFQTDFAVGDASPMSYAIGGKQYVAFIAGSKVWAFALGGTVPQAAPISAPPEEEVIGPVEDTNQIETLSLEQGPGNGHRYRLNEYAFNPYRARIRAGMSVTFINNGYMPHTIVARDGSWSTETLIPTRIATVTFDKPGEYIYFSKEYPWSYGQIIVVPAAASSSNSSESQSLAGLDQVNVGKAAYAVSCSGCHATDLNGRDPAPALVGRGFIARWTGRKALDLFDRIRTTMPPTAPGTLSDDSYAAIVSYLLYSNDNPSSGTLDRQMMKSLSVTRGTN